MDLSAKPIRRLMGAMLLCAFLAGCSNAAVEDAVTAENTISEDGTLCVSVFVDKSAVSDAVWETLQEADADALEAGISEAFTDGCCAPGNVEVGIEEDGIYAEYEFSRMDGLVFAGIGELSRDADLQDVYGYLQKQTVVSADGDTQAAVGEIPDTESCDIIYLQEDLFEAEAAAGNVLLDGFSENAVYYLTVPGNVRYAADNLEVVRYDWIKDETTLKVLSAGPVCIIAQPGLAFMWKVVIAAAATIIIIALVLTALLKRAYRRRNRGVVLSAAGEYKGARFKLKPGEEVMFGRDAGLCSVVLANQNGLVSRRHCGIRYDKAANAYCVKDYSTNGTFLRDGSRLKVGQDNILKSGSMIYLGDRDNMFRLL